VQLPLDKMLGFALETGGPTAHTTIIARSLRHPGDRRRPRRVRGGPQSRLLALDAFEGKIVFDPNPAEVAEYQSGSASTRSSRPQLLHMRSLPTVTRDGRKISSTPTSTCPARSTSEEWNVGGIGLYRSEFLYMKMSPNLPSEKEHLEVYREMVERMGDRTRSRSAPSTSGARSWPGRSSAAGEANPVLGLRGIRLCFSQPEFFRTQLRACCAWRASFRPVGCASCSP
jgi:phosphoenolpyruvate-protein phosphotransferase (PTS system enzyme I)